MALVTYKGYWIPATSCEFKAIDQGQFETEHTPVYDDHITRTKEFRYVIRSGGNSGHITELATKKSREVLIAEDPARVKSVHLKHQDS